MPMNFPDFASLMREAEIHTFRIPEVGEDEATYRACLADHVEAIDVIEGHEVRTGKGWDQWDDRERADFMRRRLLAARRAHAAVRAMELRAAAARAAEPPGSTG